MSKKKVIKYENFKSILKSEVFGVILNGEVGEINKSNVVESRILAKVNKFFGTRFVDTFFGYEWNEGMNVEHCTFENCLFVDGFFIDVNIDTCSFDNCNLSASQLAFSELKNISIT